nr:restriction endonuclease subunit S [Lactobacillus helveticus]
MVLLLFTFFVWEERKLGEISNIIAGGDKNINKIKKYGKYPVIANSINKNGIVGYYDNEYRVKAPAVTVTGRGEIGHAVARFQNFTPIVRLLALSSKLDPIFLANSINKIRFFNESTGVPQLTKPQLSTYSIIIPSVEEQNNIGKLILLIEKYIHLQQRKLRLLKLLKKATQQNIFASTECLPKLKYRDLTGKWQLYRLKDVAKITMGQSPNSKNYTQNPIDHILVQGNADIRNGYVFPRIWTTEITKIANRGDIILCVRAPAGDVGRTKFNVVIGRGVAAIKGNDFIFQQLQFMKSSGYWKKYISGSTFESINSNDIKNAKIFCPSQLEQKNISSLLDDIDTSIQIQQKNILDFKYIKQFLLQNMFI